MSKRQELTDTMKDVLRIIERKGGTLKPYGQQVGTCRALENRGYVAYVRQSVIDGYWQLTAYGRDWLSRNAK